MYKIGIDVGGTKIRGVVIDGKNKTLFDFDVPTPDNKKDFLGVLKIEITNILKRYKIASIGLGLPGIVDAKKGVLIKAPNLPFLKNWNAKDFLLKFCKKIAIENDTRCLLTAEAKLGAGKDYKNIFAMTIGTGIGGAIMIDGKIYYGKNFSAGECGHMIVDDNMTLENLGAKKAFKDYGDRSEIIGIGVANIINILDPDIIILGGGGVSSGAVKPINIKKIAKQYIMSPSAQNTPIVEAKLGKYASAIGAGIAS